MWKEKRDLREASRQIETAHAKLKTTLSSGKLCPFSMGQICDSSLGTLYNESDTTFTDLLAAKPCAVRRICMSGVSVFRPRPIKRHRGNCSLAGYLSELTFSVCRNRHGS